MERGAGNKTKTKFKKGGAPFGMFGRIGGLFSKRMHGRAHEKLGLESGDKDGKDTNEDKKNDKEAATAVTPQAPGKAPENKKEE